MANLPLPQGGLASFSQGFHMTDNLMDQILNRKKVAQQNEQFKASKEQLERHFQQNFGLHKAAAGRAAQAAMDAHAIAQQKLHPMDALKQKLQALQDWENQQKGGGNGAGSQTQQPVKEEYPDLAKMFSGDPMMPGGRLIPGNLNLDNRPQVPNPEGGTSTVYSMGIGTPEGETLIPRVSHEGKILSPDEARDYFRKTGEHMGVYGTPEQSNKAAQQIHEQQAQMIQPAQHQLLPGGIDPDDIKRALIYQAFGVKVPTTKSGRLAEPPELKAQRDYDYKIKEKKYEHELKMADEVTKKQLKEKGERDKVILAAKNDIPHLETSLRSLKIMKKIADDPKNDDMFGHWWLGNDRAAQRINNPNAGIWQTEGLGPIVDAEMKMSSRGNVVALKAAQANKPNFGEKRPVAASKIDARIKQIENQIKKTKEIAGEPENEFSKMTTEQLMAMAGGG